MKMIHRQSERVNPQHWRSEKTQVNILLVRDLTCRDTGFEGFRLIVMHRLHQ